MLGLMGFSGSLPLYVIHRYYIFVFIDRANKDACLLTLRRSVNNRPVKRLPVAARLPPAFYIVSLPHTGWNYGIVTPFL